MGYKEHKACSQISNKRKERGSVITPRINTLFIVDEITDFFKKGVARNYNPIRRYLKHFLFQNEADILELDPGFAIKDIYDSISLLKRRKLDRLLRPMQTKYTSLRICKYNIHIWKLTSRSYQ